MASRSHRDSGAIQPRPAILPTSRKWSPGAAVLLRLPMRSTAAGRLLRLRNATPIGSGSPPRAECLSPLAAGAKRGAMTSPGPKLRARWIGGSPPGASSGARGLLALAMWSYHRACRRFDSGPSRQQTYLLAGGYATSKHSICIRSSVMKSLREFASFQFGGINRARSQ